MKLADRNLFGRSLPGWVIPAALGWTLLLGTFWVLYDQQMRGQYRLFAGAGARLLLRADTVYQTWIAEQGGVYVPVSDKTPPSPYLTNVLGRDVTTSKGQRLTLVNPACMARNIRELGLQAYGIEARITSLKPLKSDNAPDAWETAALHKLQAGRKSFQEVIPVNGTNRLRFLTALRMEAQCLKCHAGQGYREGDLGGGLSVSVPMNTSVFAASERKLRNIMLGLAGVWVLGLAGITWGGLTTRRRDLEREQAQVTLRESEEKYRGIFDEAVAAIYVFDNQKHFLDTNQAGLDLLGYSREELLRLSIPDVDADPVVVLPAHQQLLSGGRIVNYEHRLRRKDGTVMTVLNNSRPLTDPHGNVVGMQSTLIDITERKRTAEALILSESKLRAILEYSNDAIGVHVDGIFEMCNSATARLFGVSSPSELIGTSILKAVAFSERSRVSDFVRRRTAGTEAPQAYITRGLRRDGTEFDMEVTLSTYQLEGKRHVLVILRDITERKRVEESLRQSEARYRTLFESSHDAIMTLFPPDWKFRSANAATLAMFGAKDEQEFASLGPWEVSPERQPDGQLSTEKARHLIATAMETGSDFFDWTHQRIGGGSFSTTVLLTAVELEGEKGLLVTVRDITAHKRAEATREALLSLATELSTATTPPEAARTIFAASDRLWHWDAGTLDVYSAESDLVSAVVSYDTIAGEGRSEMQAYPPGEPTPRTRRILTQGAELILRQPPFTPPPDAVMFGDTSRPSASIMCVPIWQQGRPVGVLSLQSYAPNAFTHDDLRTLQGLADQCGGALERIQAAEALRENEERYRKLFEEAGEGIAIADWETGVILDCNAVFARMLGRERKELIGLPQQALHPAAPENKQFSSSFTGHRAERAGQVLEDRVLTANGEIRDVEIEAHVLELRGRRIVQGFFRDITARKQAEATLSNTQDRFRRVIENAEVGYFRIGLDGSFQHVNPAWLRMHGFASADEIIGRHFSVTQVEEDLPHAREIFERLLRGEAVPAVELSRRCRDGSIGFHLFSACPIQQHDRIVGFEGFLTDTTALRQARADYETLFNRMIDGFAVHEIILDAGGKPVDYRFLSVNPAFEKLTGLKAVAVVGRTFKEVMPEEELFWLETYGRVALTGEPASFERYNLRLGRHFEVAAFSPSRGQFACVFVDVTEEKRAVAALQRDEAQLSAIYEHAPIMMCLMNQSREVERMNRAMTDLVGGPLALEGHRRPGDILGCLNSLDDPSGCGAGPLCLVCVLRGAMIETLETGESRKRVETPLSLARNGVRREIRVSASTALVRIEGEDKLLLCLEDITAHKQLEAQYLQAQKMEAVGTLAGGVAHDFNNILAATLMHLNLLQDTPGLDPEMVASLKELESQAQRGASLTRQLLTFSRRSAFQPRRLNLSEIIEGMMKMLGRLLGEHIEVRLACVPEALWVVADAGMLEQVIMNLCVNARDAMPKGGRLTLETAYVEIGPDEALRHAEARVGRFVRLSVIDTGCGMEEATLKRIFEPFFTTKEAGKGTGLGLATVYGIARQHEGWVAVRSAVGVGTTFQVFLPVATREVAAAAAHERGQMPRGHGTILLVEDDLKLLKLAARVLRGCGYRVLEARNGIEALNVWEETGRQAQLLLTDVVMPGGVSGIELVEALRRVKPGLKVIMTSGYSDEILLRGSEGMPGSSFLPKPYAPADLAKIVRECLEGKG